MKTLYTLPRRLLSYFAPSLAVSVGFFLRFVAWVAAVVFTHDMQVGTIAGDTLPIPGGVHDGASWKCAACVFKSPGARVDVCPLCGEGCYEETLCDAYLDYTGNYVRMATGKRDAECMYGPMSQPIFGNDSRVFPPAIRQPCMAVLDSSQSQGISFASGALTQAFAEQEQFYVEKKGKREGEISA